MTELKCDFCDETQLGWKQYVVHQIIYHKRFNVFKIENMFSQEQCKRLMRGMGGLGR